MFREHRMIARRALRRALGFAPEDRITVAMVRSAIACVQKEVGPHRERLVRVQNGYDRALRHANDTELSELEKQIEASAQICVRMGDTLAGLALILSRAEAAESAEVSRRPWPARAFDAARRLLCAFGPAYGTTSPSASRAATGEL